jgi:PST family polysaccharide transporter
MLTLNYKKEFSNILILASLINIVLALIMVPILKHIGISLSVLLSEIFVTISMMYFLNKKGIKIIRVKLV